MPWYSWPYWLRGIVLLLVSTGATFYLIRVSPPYNRPAYLRNEKLFIGARLACTFLLIDAIVFLLYSLIS